MLAATLREQAGNASILANPRIRVRQREKAKVLIGDRVPVITTTATADGFVAESVNYIDVGIKLEVEPEIYANDEVGVSIALEVSNIAREIRTASGSLAYQLGTRAASTLLQLRDGETQVLAGLIKDEVRRSANQVPLLGEIPILGRLFSQRNNSHTKTEVVLLITPRIVRGHMASGPSSEVFASGTASSVGMPLYRHDASDQVSKYGESKPMSIGHENRSSASKLADQAAEVNAAASNTKTSRQDTTGTAVMRIAPPQTIPIGRETAIPLSFETISAPIASGNMELRFDADRFHGAFSSGVRGIDGAVDNALGAIRIRVFPEVPISAGAEFGQFKLTPIGLATGATNIEVVAADFISPRGDKIAITLPPAQSINVVR